MSRFIEMNWLRSMPFAGCNRDDAGLPKTLTLGGWERSRWSSQTLKRATRSKTFFNLPKSKKIDQTFRTKHLPKSLADIISEKQNIEVDKVLDTLTRVFTKLVLKTSENAKERLETPVYISENEINKIADIFIENWETIVKESGNIVIKGQKNEESETEDGDEKLPELPKKRGRKTKSENGEEDKDSIFILLNKGIEMILSEGKNLEILLHGRMFASIATANVDSNLAVAHAFSTNERVHEEDYFNVMEELAQNGDRGSAHIGSTGYSNPDCMYQYMVIDFGNYVLDIAKRFNVTIADAEKKACEFLKPYLSSWAEAVPTGGMSRTAHYCRAQFAFAVIRESQPENLSPAFEIPARAENKKTVIQVSVEKLVKYWQGFIGMYGETGILHKLVCHQTEADTSGLQAEKFIGLDEMVKKLIEYLPSKK